MRQKLLTGAALCAAACIIALNVWALPIYPEPTCDEALNASPAVSLLQSNGWGLDKYQLGDPFYRDLNMVHMGRLPTLALALIYRLGGVSWWLGRVYGLLGWLLAVYLTYALGHKLFSKPVGLGAAAVFGTSGLAFLVGHSIRPDVWAAAFILVGLLGLFTLLEAPRFWPGMLYGLIAMLAVDYHFYTISFVVGFCLVVFLDCGIRQKQWGAVFGYAAGTLAGCGLWLLVHLFPYPQQSIYQLTTGYRMLGNLPLANGVGANLGSFVDWVSLVYWRAGFPLTLLITGLAALGVIFALYRKDRFSLWLLVILATATLIFAFVMGQRFIQYGIHWLPVLMILGAKALLDLPEMLTVGWPGLSLPLHTYSAAIGLIVLANLAGNIWLTYRFYGPNYAALGSQIDAVVPQGVTIMADSTWWWALRQGRTYTESDVIKAVRGSMTTTAFTPSPQQVIEETFVRFPIDYLAIDANMGCASDTSEDWQALLDYAKAVCQQTDQFVGPWAGRENYHWFLYAQTTTIYHCPASSAP